MEVQKFNYMLEIDILRNSLQKILVVFKGLGVQKDTLLAKTMHGNSFIMHAK